MNIIEELYYGNVDPTEKSVDKNSDYYKFVKAVSEIEDKLNETLNDGEKQLFSKLMNAQNEVLCITDKERFIEGWKLGARFILDTFITQRDSPLTGII